MRNLFFLALLCLAINVSAQNGVLKGKVTSTSGPIPYVTVTLAGTTYTNTTDDNGDYQLKNIKPGSYEVVFSSVGYVNDTHTITIAADQTVSLSTQLKENTSKLNEVVVTGVSRRTQLRSNPVPIAVMSKKEMDENVNNNIIDAK